MALVGAKPIDELLPRLDGQAKAFRLPKAVPIDQVGLDCRPILGDTRIRESSNHRKRPPSDRRPPIAVPGKSRVVFKLAS